MNNNFATKKEKILHSHIPNILHKISSCKQLLHLEKRLVCSLCAACGKQVEQANNGNPAQKLHQGFSDRLSSLLGI